MEMRVFIFNKENIKLDCRAFFSYVSTWEFLNRLEKFEKDAVISFGVWLAVYNNNCSK